MTEKLRQTLAGLQEELHERQQAETALRESEERIHALLGAFPDMLLELSLDRRVINMVPPAGLETAIPPEIFIEVDGGQLWVESEVDKGSTFFFTLPLSGTAAN